MTEEMETRPAPLPTKMFGIAGIAVLTLTACAPDDDQPEDAAQEDVDPDGAEDQGDEPDEIAEEEPENEAPEISEIESQLWDTMDQAESVVLDAEVPSDADEVEGEVDIDDAGTITQHYSGQVDGSALTMREESDAAQAEYITFEDATYLRGEDELRAVGEQFPGEIDEDELEDEFAGRWVDYSEIFPEGFTITEWLDEFRESLESGGGFDELEAAAETRDGEEVWVYTGDGREVVVRAGEEPVLLSVHAEDETGHFDVRFSDWNEAEEPERPADEDILTVQDIEELLS
ncbi:hypothetical protein [Nesterenkonia sp. HG001]|uniref:hypothetical protein n=1 Tax=Nesterenkonia sp. HG001 TaxID=2983207 RepID=UPI002AC77196|nr:hypothetical protein [Nesterenkonia sp. HG001]MDZ5076830.1 hypothetical protein [Nesterenkonia sp. HG001]